MKIAPLLEVTEINLVEVMNQLNNNFNSINARVNKPISPIYKLMFLKWKNTQSCYVYLLESTEKQFLSLVEEQSIAIDKNSKNDFF